MRLLSYYFGKRFSTLISQWVFWISLTTAAVVIVLWFQSYRTYRHGSIDIRMFAERFELIQTQGTVFFEWSEIRRTPKGRWEPGAQVEIDDLFCGFGFYVWPGQWTRAGELVIPYWALFVLLLVPALVPIARYLKRPKTSR
jgi:hypothetical protein